MKLLYFSPLDEFVTYLFICVYEVIRDQLNENMIICWIFSEFSQGVELDTNTSILPFFYVMTQNVIYPLPITY